MYDGIEPDLKTIERNTFKKVTLGVLTSGGDSQGMNAALKGVVRMGLWLGCRVYYIREGYQGMIDGGSNFVEADWASASRIIHIGGTVIGSARCMDFKKVSGRMKAAKNLVDRGISRLVVIGGDGSLTGANTLRTEWQQILDALICGGKINRDQAHKHRVLHLAGIVGSIDNDFCETDMTIGSDSALHRIIEAVNILKSTAYSHQRCFVLEVMGRRCGYLGLSAAIAIGADYAFYPELPAEENWEDDMCEKLNARRKSGRRLNIVIVSEGAIDYDGKIILSQYVCDVIQAKLKIDSRVTVLGHLQRGGVPSCFDRLLGIRMGSDAALAVCESTGDPVVITIDGIKIRRIRMEPLVEKTLSVKKAFETKRWDLIRQIRGHNFISKMRIYTIMSYMEPKNFTHELNGRTFAIMHIGGVSSGFNSVARTVVRYSLSKGAKMLAVSDGIDGLSEGKITEVTWFESLKWVGPGTVLGTSRNLPENKMEAIAKNIAKFNIDGIFIAGGFRGFTACIQFLEARKLYPEFNIPFILIPATVSNNVPGTDLCIGSDTALNEIQKICDCVKMSSDGNQKRLFVIETMGSYCGYLPTMSSISSGADALYIPEIPFSIKDLFDDVYHMKLKIDSGISRGLVIRGDDACPYYTTDFMHRLFVKEGDGFFVTRSNKTGHILQGPSSPFDRKLSIRYAMKAVEWMEKQFSEGRHKSGSETISVVGCVAGQYKMTAVESLIKISDFEKQTYSHPWWLHIIPLFRIICKHPGMYEQGKTYTETFI